MVLLSFLKEHFKAKTYRIILYFKFSIILKKTYLLLIFLILSWICVSYQTGTSLGLVFKNLHGEIKTWGLEPGFLSWNLYFLK